MPITGGVHDISWMGLVELGVSGRRRSRLSALDSGPFEVEENDDKRKTIDSEDLSGHRPCRQGICSWRGTSVGNTIAMKKAMLNIASR